MPQLSLLYTTFASEEVAFQVSKELLAVRLVACANLLGNIKFLCIWEGHLEESSEVAVLFKTTTDKAPFAIQKLEELHPYRIPAILQILVQEGSELFSKWVQDSLR